MDSVGPPAPLSDVTATAAVRKSEPRRLGRRRAWWVIALASLAAVLLRITYINVPSDTDEGGFAYVAHRWAQGAHLYQDVWVDRPPLLLAVFRWATAIAYESWALRVVAMLVAVGLVVGVAACAWALRGSTAAAAAALLFAVFGVAPRLEGYHLIGEYLASFCATWGIAVALWWRARGRRDPWLLSAAGALAACGPLMKQSGFDGAIVVLFVTLTSAEPGRRIGASVRVVAGAAVPFALTVVHGLVLGWSQFWYAVVGFRLGPASDPNGISGRWHSLTGSSGRVLLDLGPLILAAVVGGVFCWRRREWVPLVWIAAATFAVVSGPYAWPHYALQQVAPMALLAGIAIAELPLGRVRVTRAFVLAALLLAPLLNTLFFATVSEHRREQTLVTNKDARANDEIAPWLRQHAAPGDQVYALAASADLYIKTHRQTDYRYLWWANLLYVPRAVPDLKAYLSGSNAPEWVVVYQSPYRLDDTGDLSSILAERYSRVAIVADRAILHLK